MGIGSGAEVFFDSTEDKELLLFKLVLRQGAAAYL
jgi:hypothetical protein